MGFRAAEEIVDAEVVGGPTQPAVHRPGSRPGVVTVNTNPDGSSVLVDSQTGNLVPSQLVPLDVEQKARAVAMFVRIPFFAYLSFNARLPAAVRLGAGALAVWEVIQIARNAKEIEAMLPDSVQ